jgi:hypothetical protein
VKPCTCESCLQRQEELARVQARNESRSQKPSGLESRSKMVNDALEERIRPGGSLWAHVVHESYGARFDPDCPVCLGVIRAFADAAPNRGLIPRGI